MNGFPTLPKFGPAFGIGATFNPFGGGMSAAPMPAPNFIGQMNKPFSGSLFGMRGFDGFPGFGLANAFGNPLVRNLAGQVKPY